MMRLENEKTAPLNARGPADADDRTQRHGVWLQKPAKFKSERSRHAAFAPEKNPRGKRIGENGGKGHAPSAHVVAKQSAQSGVWVSP